MPLRSLHKYPHFRVLSPSSARLRGCPMLWTPRSIGRAQSQSGLVWPEIVRRERTLDCDLCWKAAMLPRLSWSAQILLSLGMWDAQALRGDCHSKKTLRESAQPTSLESQLAPEAVRPELPPGLFFHTWPTPPDCPADGVGGAPWSGWTPGARTHWHLRALPCQAPRQCIYADPPFQGLRFPPRLDE